MYAELAYETSAIKNTTNTIGVLLLFFIGDRTQKLKKKKKKEEKKELTCTISRKALIHLRSLTMYSRFNLAHK